MKSKRGQKLTRASVALGLLAIASMVTFIDHQRQGLGLERQSARTLSRLAVAAIAATGPETNSMLSCPNFLLPRTGNTNEIRLKNPETITTGDGFTRNLQLLIKTGSFIPLNRLNVRQFIPFQTPLRIPKQSLKLDNFNPLHLSLKNPSTPPSPHSPPEVSNSAFLGSFNRWGPLPKPAQITLFIFVSITGTLLMLHQRSLKMQTQWGERLTDQISGRLDPDSLLSLLDTNPAFNCAIKPDGTVLFMNQAMLASTGYTPLEAIGRNYIHTFIPQTEQASIIQTFEQLTQQTQPQRLQHPILTKEGQEIWVAWCARAVFRGDRPELDYWIATGIEIEDPSPLEVSTHLGEELTQAVNAAPDFESALNIALCRLGETLGYSGGEAWVVNPEGNALYCASLGYETERRAYPLWLEVNQGLPGRVMASGQPEWMPDISSEPDPEFLLHHPVADSGLTSALGLPIFADRQVLAVLVWFHPTPWKPNSQTLDWVSSLAVQVGSILHRLQTLQALQQAEANYRSIVKNAVEGIFQTTPDGQYLSANPALAAMYGYSSLSELMAHLCDRADQLYVDPRCQDEFIRLLQENEVVSGFEAQVYRADGSMIWISQNARAVRDVRDKLMYYEGSVVNITDRKWTEEQLRYNASHDALTGLWNRAFFMDRLVKAVSRAQSEASYEFAVLFMDLDDFKLVNDSLGHSVGDRLLMAIAGRLEQCLGPYDTLARFGGDEFTVLLEDIPQVEDAIAVAHQVHETLRKPFNVGSYEVFAGMSIGIVHSTAGDRRQPDFLRDADIAMYRAKAREKGGYVVFDTTMREEAILRLELETDLRWAVERGEFQMFYQPIVRLSTGEISGFEALIRWYHPRKGWISPNLFIPVAEETGSIEPIGEWALIQACHQLRSWKKQFPTYPSLKMSVNLSGKQLTENLSDRIEEILQETGVDGWDLKLEITETALVEDPESAIALLDRLKALDIQLCIDDFGTGYSSLSYLHRFPVDILKIDRSFVSQMSPLNDDAEIVRTIVTLAHTLGLDVIAEGIETLDALQQLELLRCKYGQGYFFSEPVNGEAAGLLLTEGQLRDLEVS